jgi:hypothetical protein
LRLTQPAAEALLEISLKVMQSRQVGSVKRRTASAMLRRVKGGRHLPSGGPRAENERRDQGKFVRTQSTIFTLSPLTRRSLGTFFKVKCHTHALIMI